jgi:hypothetical protein
MRNTCGERSRTMEQKMESNQLLASGEKGSQDYSAFLELAEKEKKNKEEVNDRMNERLKFLETEEAKMAMLEEDSAANVDEIVEQQKLVDNINDEVLELGKTKSEIEKKIELYLQGDRGAKEILEGFKSDIEN